MTPGAACQHWHGELGTECGSGDDVRAFMQGPRCAIHRPDLVAERHGANPRPVPTPEERKRITGPLAPIPPVVFVDPVKANDRDIGCGDGTSPMWRGRRCASLGTKTPCMLCPSSPTYWQTTYPTTGYGSTNHDGAGNRA